MYVVPNGAISGQLLEEYKQGNFMYLFIYLLSLYINLHIFLFIYLLLICLLDYVAWIQLFVY